MKVVINKQFGGFSLSALAVKKYAEKKGRECYFFVNPREPKFSLDKFVPVTVEEANKSFIFYAFDVPNPEDFSCPTEKWFELTQEERTRFNELYSGHLLGAGRDVDRADPDLIAVVEELGEAANGSHATLEIFEIPDGTNYQIDEYDGNESIHEVHQSWG